jgi:hypothetical protein
MVVPVDALLPATLTLESRGEATDVRLVLKPAFDHEVPSYFLMMKPALDAAPVTSAML